MLGTKNAEITEGGFFMKTTDTIYVSKKGLKELKKKIARLEREWHELRRILRESDKTEGHEERLERVERLAQLSSVEYELNEKKHLLANAKMLPRKRDAVKVALGSVVDLIDTKGRLVRYTLVESFEADPSDGRISTQSPLGKNLIGKQLQDIVEWSTGLKTSQLRLVNIA